MSIREVNGKYGPVKFFGKDEYVGKSLYNYGEFSPIETARIVGLAGDGVVLDIGANIGCISQALIVAGKTVQAFEPQPAVYDLLKWNCAHALGVGPWMVHNCGLGSEAGIAKMPRVRYEERNNIGGLGIGMRGVYGTIDVDVRRLDDLGIEGISFMKIDVEGYEIEVLKGGRETILRDKPIMYIEDDREAKSYELRKYIRELGYTIEEDNTPLFVEDNFFGKKQNVWGQTFVSFNLICKPC